MRGGFRSPRKVQRVMFFAGNGLYPALSGKWEVPVTRNAKIDPGDNDPPPKMTQGGNDPP